MFVKNRGYFKKRGAYVCCFLVAVVLRILLKLLGGHINAHISKKNGADMLESSILGKYRGDT